MVLAAALIAAAPAHSVARLSGSFPAGAYSGMAWYLVGFELGPWEQYLVHELTPELERMAPVELPRVSWLQFDETIILPEFAHSMFNGNGRPPLALSFVRARTSLLLGDDLAGSLNEGRQFERSLVMPGVTHRVNDSSALTVSAVLASQRFGAADLNLRAMDERPDSLGSSYAFERNRAEVSHGTGLRFALASEINSGVRLEAAFQSRIDMEEFATVRGVHGMEAELDIPPRVQLGLELAATDQSSLNVGISQIFYSDIGAFPSRSLPARFTALLGDRNSPVFAWDDLTVFSLGWHWQPQDDLEFYVDYRTRTQPSPTAPTLARALDSELAQNAVIAGLSKGVGKGSQFRVNAAYAPPEYAFGGNVLGVVTDKLDQGLEVQALLDFEF